jgi:ubiquinone/menaquinone biosynthesis C-methylase UbiE
MQARERIEAVYARREAAALGDRYSLLSPANLFMAHQRERELVRQLRRRGMTPERLEQCRVLEVGCGSGGNLRRMIDYGVPPGNLVGFDLLPERLRQSRRQCREIGILQADGTAMPFAAARFDLILHFGVFSSIGEAETRRAFAAEMRRVLRPDGLILWYEFCIDNPKNQDVKAVTPAELRTLFPDCDCAVARTVLAPPLTRSLYRWSPGLCELLARVPFLLTHYVASLQPRATASRPVCEWTAPSLQTRFGARDAQA